MVNIDNVGEKSGTISSVTVRQADDEIRSIDAREREKWMKSLKRMDGRKIKIIINNG